MSVIGREPVAVSITPMALEADSRAFKIAVSLRRFGYRSIVLEGSASAQDFAPFGLEVHSLGAPNRPSAAQHEKNPSNVPARKHWLWGNWARLFVFYARFFRRYFFVPFRQLPRADLYYVHSYEYLAVALVRRRGARVVYDAHDFYQGNVPIQEQSHFVRFYLLPAMARIERLSARRCDAVVTVSSSVASALAETIGVKPVVVMNAVDSRNNRKSGTTIRKVLNLTSDDCLLVMIGNRKDGFSVDFVAAMLRQLPPHIHVAFMGRGFEGNLDVSRCLGVEGRLHFLPAVPAAEVSAFIAGADAGLLLYRPISRNYRSALPNRFFHVIDAGLPLARFPLPEIEAAIGGRAVGPVLDATNPATAAQQVMSFLSDPQARLRCAAVAAAIGRDLSWAAQESVLRTVCTGITTRR
jgi:hypothetical protein